MQPTIHCSLGSLNVPLGGASCSCHTTLVVHASPAPCLLLWALYRLITSPYHESIYVLEKQVQYPPVTDHIRGCSPHLSRKTWQSSAPWDGEE